MGRRRKKVRDGESKGGNRGHFSRRRKAKGMRSPHDTGRSFLPSPTSGPAVFRRRGVVRPLRYSVRVYSSRKSRQKMSGGRRRACDAFPYPPTLSAEEKDDREEESRRSRPILPPRSHLGPLGVQSEGNRSGLSMFGPSLNRSAYRQTDTQAVRQKDRQRTRQDHPIAKPIPPHDSPWCVFALSDMRLHHPTLSTELLLLAGLGDRPAQHRRHDHLHRCEAALVDGAWAPCDRGEGCR